MFYTHPSKKVIVRILRKHPLFKLKGTVLRAFVVGSQVTGKTHETSDVDILLEVKPVVGMTADEVEQFYRRKLQAYFMKNNIRGKHDDLHPQWCNRRVDVYFTYNAEPDSRPKGLLLC